MKPKVSACCLATLPPSLPELAPASIPAIASPGISPYCAGFAVETLRKTAKTGQFRGAKILLFGFEDTIRIRSRARGGSGLLN